VEEPVSRLQCLTVGWGLVPGLGNICFLCCLIRTGTDPFTYLVCTGAISKWLKRSGREAGHPRPFGVCEE
jgi:hypothetical protein